jgi:hypothetical protein
MNGRVHLRIVFLFGGFVAFDLACQALSPYPSVYDKVYEAGSQGPQTVASTTSDASVATEDAAEGALDGETVDGDSESAAPTPTCPAGANVFAAAADPQTITLDGTNAYWTNDPPGGTGIGSIAYLARASAAGAAAKTLAPNLSEPLFVANANGYVAWSGVGTVGLVNVMSLTITSTFTTSASSSVAGVAVGPTDAYWLSNSGGVISVQSAPVIGGSAVQVGTVSTASLPAGLSIQGNTLYFAAFADPSSSSPGSGGAIYQAPIAGGSTPTAMQTFSSGTPNDVVTDSANIYWTDLYANGGSVFSMPLAGGPITTMASTLGVPHYLAVDSTNVYTADFIGGAVYEIPLGTPAGAGGTPKVLVTGGSPTAGIAADDNQAVVYFTSASAICTVAK